MRHFSILILIIIIGGCAKSASELQFAYEEQTMAVVFDIDGTLTPRPIEMWTAREDAAKAVHIFAAKGYQIVYLSARVRPFQATIPRWLEENGFPHGSLLLTETAEDRKDPVYFKTRMLQDLRAHGWELAFAFGDSSTDFEAYTAVGIPTERVFALRREGEDTCQPGAWKACLNGWTEYIDAIAQ